MNFILFNTYGVMPWNMKTVKQIDIENIQSTTMTILNASPLTKQTTNLIQLKVNLHFL
jgi:hypothetical protein